MASSNGPCGRERSDASPVSTVSPFASAAHAVTRRVVVPLFAQSITSSGTAGRPATPVTFRSPSVRSIRPPKASTDRIVARVSALTSGSATTAPSLYPAARIARCV